MFIQTENGHTFRHQRDELLETRLAHKTKAAVMVAAFSIVPVENDDRIKTKFAEDVDAINPMQGLSDFIKFVQRQGKSPNSQSCALVVTRQPPLSMRWAKISGTGDSFDCSKA
jgi:hypothetical protein